MGMRKPTLLEHFPVVGLLGARQVGKTTIAVEWSNTETMPRPEPVEFAAAELMMAGVWIMVCSSRLTSQRITEHHSTPSPKEDLSRPGRGPILEPRP